MISPRASPLVRSRSCRSQPASPKGFLLSCGLETSGLARSGPGFDFHHRPARVAEKLVKFLVGPSAFSLSDVAGDRNRSAPDLTGEPKALANGEVLCVVVNLRHQLHGLLPSNQIAIRFPHL